MRLQANISITRSDDSSTDSVFVSSSIVVSSRLSAEGSNTLSPHKPAEESPVTVPKSAPCGQSEESEEMRSEESEESEE